MGRTVEPEYGCQYRGLLSERDDILGIGWTQVCTDGAQFSTSYEGILKLYYRGAVSPWLHLSPHIQHVVNPGSQDFSNGLTLGLGGRLHSETNFTCAFPGTDGETNWTHYKRY
jgi:hypothetical protein